MIAWGEALIKELAARRCVIFLGAGASMGCISAVNRTSPPSWPVLLHRLATRICAETRAYAEQLIDAKKYLDAAEVIKSEIDPADYTDTMRAIFEEPRFEKSSIHESVLRIDPKVVVTTNFDRIYDNYCLEGQAVAGYNVCKYHDNHLVSDLRSPIRSIVKAHGCISAPEKMVLTRSDFFTAKADYSSFFQVLDALFLTHTILFIGYSMEDPDIQLILENATIASPSAHRHHFVCSDEEHPVLKASKAKAFNLTLHEFPQGDYSYLEHSISDLADRVISAREDQPQL